MALTDVGGPEFPLRLEWLDPSSLDDNPANWRTHPADQTAALDGVIGEVGWAGVLLYNERTKHLIDGHARKKVAQKRGGPVPVVIGSWSEEQERLILSSLDPIGAMAKSNADKLGALLDQVKSQGGPVKALLDKLAQDNKPAEANVEPMDLQAPPTMVWVLVGIPLNRYGEVREHVAALEAVGEISVQTNREG